MKIFLSYSSKDRELVAPVALALNAQEHDVFFDQEDLPAGEEYDQRIRRAIHTSHLFIFLVSPNSLAHGSYARAELEIAEKSWPHPKGRVLPVMLRDTAFDQMPPYLTAVTLLNPQGNATAAVADEVARIANKRRRKISIYAGAAAATAIVIAAALLWRPSATITGEDGAIALPVPEGKSVMGDDENFPRHEVFLNGFYLDQHEITVSQFEKFLRATGMNANKPADSAPQHPIVGVTWHEADAYCRWAGKRLPTNAEWEKAARGADERQYPWGNGAPAAHLATFASNGLTPVGSHEGGKSPYGMDDMAGNGAEWVADWYSETVSPHQEGPERGESKVIRGGSFYDPPERLITTKRMHAGPEQRLDDTGFRCALDFSR
ncbi:MAG: SUMF1/EgtB/PvdO family nonheme iron enzyme [Burkholderiales bacterium]